MAKKGILFPFLLALAFLLAGCAEITIYNNAKFPAAVQVFTPDSSSGQTATIAPGTSTTFYTFSGGSYRVNVIRNEEYRAHLQNMQSTAASVLFGDLEAAGGLNFRAAINLLSGTQAKLDQLATEKGASCTGRIREFDFMGLLFGEADPQDQQVFSVPLTFDENLNEWFALCLESN